MRVAMMKRLCSQSLCISSGATDQHQMLTALSWVHIGEFRLISVHSRVRRWVLPNCTTTASAHLCCHLFTLTSASLLVMLCHSSQTSVIWVGENWENWVYTSIKQLTNNAERNISYSIGKTPTTLGKGAQATHRLVAIIHTWESSFRGWGCE